ncbi:hypothetical protein AAFF_G00127140 [Aldrovandia affinis]|uniref:SRCR domain-containing protein n=1 Tax=Aldrovandia affinis TaxID=143900 RepID=A0AAD7WXA6_9TELE|nr:hypothetical protein AAFF_G00127140 [Aldrovandia affinis]
MSTFLFSLCPSALPTLRLVDGDGNRCQGRVEVRFRSTWGTVCDDGWDAINTDVVCREVGCGLGLELKVGSFFGFGFGPILLDNVRCKGHEDHLTDCFHLGWGGHNCDHNEDVGVICSGADSHGHVCVHQGQWLVGGQHQCEGRVEIFTQAQWGTVCDDSWGLADAQVICRQIGCGEATHAQGEAFFGQGSGTILLDNLKCSGMEASLQECSHIPWNIHNCDHSEDASVTCTLL